MFMAKKILIVNKFMYPRGGDCIVALSEAELLRAAGHEVALWAMDYPDNLPSPTQRFYAPEVDFFGGPVRKYKALRRTMGLGDIRESFSRMLDYFRPDTVHFHNIHSYLSPVIVEMAHERGLHTLWTMHDYKIICPSYSCLTPDCHPCRACADNPSAVLKRRCMKGSRIASIAAWAEARKWNRERLVKATDTFICPSSFLRSLIVSAGIPADKTAVIGNFLDPGKNEILKSIPHDSQRDPGLILYVGRLSPEKGIRTLLKAFTSIADPGLTLRIYGTGPMEKALHKDYVSTPGVEFMGQADAPTVISAMARAQMLVCPSECYENNPLSIIEALSTGTPVLGAHIGGIPELITPENGMLFEPIDSKSLARGIHSMFNRTFDHEAIRTAAAERFSPERHLNLLNNLL